MRTKHVLTGEDGTRYQIQDDGTVGQIVERGRKPPPCPGRDGGERPLVWSELRDRPGLAAGSCEVPKKLRKLWSDLSIETPAALRGIARDAYDRPALASGHRPDWTGSTFKPRSSARPRPPRVRRRGVDLDPLVVWGFDDRVIYNDTNYPWGCVCRIITGRGVGSGVLVGPRHVLTASHIVDWDRPGATIEVNRFEWNTAASARATAVWFYTKVGAEGVDHDEVDEDYAVFVTDQRLGDRFGWMGTRTYDSAWDGEDYWHNIGYPEDIGVNQSPIWQHNQNLDEDEWDFGGARAMTTSADVVKGQSGGPMFGFWDDIPYVVAVVSAEGSYAVSGSENWCSGGSDLTRLVNDARAGDP